jgi:DNA-directed RNA polymerase subunit L
METTKITANKYRFIFKNETFTIVHLLQNELLSNEYVENVGYEQTHPLETQMILNLTTNTKNPREILNVTIDKLVEKIDLIKSLCEHLE